MVLPGMSCKAVWHPKGRTLATHAGEWMDVSVVLVSEQTFLRRQMHVLLSPSFVHFESVLLLYYGLPSPPCDSSNHSLVFRYPSSFSLPRASPSLLFFPFSNLIILYKSNNKYLQSYFHILGCHGMTATELLAGEFKRKVKLAIDLEWTTYDQGVSYGDGRRQLSLFLPTLL